MTHLAHGSQGIRLTDYYRLLTPTLILTTREIMVFQVVRGKVNSSSYLSLIGLLSPIQVHVTCAIMLGCFLPLR